MSEYMSEYITHFKCTKTSKIIIPIQIFRKTFKVIEYNIIYLIQTCKNRMRGVQNHYFCMLLFSNNQPFFIPFCCWGKSWKHYFTWNSLSSIWNFLHMDEICTLFPNYYFQITCTPLLTTKQCLWHFEERWYLLCSRQILFILWLLHACWLWSFESGDIKLENF